MNPLQTFRGITNFPLQHTFPLLPFVLLFCLPNRFYCLLMRWLCLNLPVSVIRESMIWLSLMKTIVGCERRTKGQLLLNSNKFRHTHRLSDIVYHHSTICISVVHRSKWFVSFLSSSVPGWWGERWQIEDQQASIPSNFCCESSPNFKFNSCLFVETNCLCEESGWLLQIWK